jgi:hypothetical protein
MTALMAGLAASGLLMSDSYVLCVVLVFAVCLVCLCSFRVELSLRLSGVSLGPISTFFRLHFDVH